jgi:hypothetical protein
MLVSAESWRIRTSNCALIWGPHVHSGTLSQPQGESSAWSTQLFPMGIALAVASVSAGSLAYEGPAGAPVLLVFQYHYAFMAISLAVLGLALDL